MDNQNFVIYFSEKEKNGLSGMARWLKGVGTALLLLGILSIVMPYIGTLTVNILVAFVLLVSGGMHLVYALNMRKWRTTTWEILTALVFLITGALFAVYPQSGAFALTLLLGVFFMIIGLFKIMLAMAWRMRPGWGMIVAAGILSILLGLLMIGGLPATAAWAIGLIMGIELVFTGATLIALGVKVKTLI
jgi:uncharacterized membrane protein HdeD (DUF308 family)